MIMTQEQLKDVEYPLFSLNEAVTRGIERVRQPSWADELDHIKIDLFPDGTHGPWIHFYCPYNTICNGRDPVNMIWLSGGVMDFNARGFCEYTGPLPDSDEYKAKIAEYAKIPE